MRWYHIRYSQMPGRDQRQYSHTSIHCIHGSVYQVVNPKVWKSEGRKPMVYCTVLYCTCSFTCATQCIVCCETNHGLGGVSSYTVRAFHQFTSNADIVSQTRLPHTRGLPPIRFQEREEKNTACPRRVEDSNGWLTEYLEYSTSPGRRVLDDQYQRWGGS